MTIGAGAGTSGCCPGSAALLLRVIPPCTPGVALQLDPAADNVDDVLALVVGELGALDDTVGPCHGHAAARDDLPLGCAQVKLGAERLAADQGQTGIEGSAIGLHHQPASP